MNYQILNDKKHANREAEEKEESDEELEDLDEDQIHEILKHLGIIKKSKDEVKEVALFVGPPMIECPMSIYLFSKENYFRIACYRLAQHPRWEQTILLLIILSSLKLATDTYNHMYHPASEIHGILSKIDDAFNYAFIVESVVRIIAMGFIMDDGSYLRNSWNQLDFFIVVSSIANMLLKDFKVPFIRVLRMLRTLRPLRFISKNKDLKMVVVALLESIGHIVNVLVVVAMVYLIFAILGVNFMNGKFFYCSLDPYLLHTEDECLLAGGEWQV